MVESSLGKQVRAIGLKPWSMVEVHVAPLIRDVLATDPDYGKKFERNMMDAVNMLDTFAADAAEVAASGGDPRTVSEDFIRKLEQLKTSVSVKTPIGKHGQAIRAKQALQHVQALMDWDNLEANL
jgi:hypothetical protein